MERESNVINYCIEIVQHLQYLSESLELDPNYDIVMKYAILNLRRVNRDKHKHRDRRAIYSLSDWAVELARLALCTGREVNRIRKSMGMSAVDLEGEALKKERQHAKDSTDPTQDSTA